MTMESAPVSFGRYLKSLRLEKGLDLNDISDRTHVSRDSLLLLEREDHEKLPPPIYVKGFIRAYSDVLGADAADVLNRYTNDLQRKNAHTRETEYLRSRYGFWSRIMIAVSTLMLVIFISIFGLRHLGDDAVRMHSNASSKEIVAFDAGVQPSEKQMTDIAPLTDTGPEMLVLRVIALEPTWFKAIIDGREPLEFKLKPQDQLEFEAQSYFNLLVGNATGVKLLLNDKAVHVSGASGEIVTIRLP